MKKKKHNPNSRKLLFRPRLSQFTMKKKKHHPKSRNRHRRNTWSELPTDLLSSVFEHLGFADFNRAKTICSSWHSASRHAKPKNQIPWLILFHQDNNSCTLFNPEEEDKLYKTQDLGAGFSKSVCLATHGNWLLMQDFLYNLYIVNIFTTERITLPSFKSRFVENIYVVSPVFWVDEKTKDYVVIWGLEELSVVYAKKGDSMWKEIPDISECYDMVYKDHKLYFSSHTNIFKIFDFSGDTPQQTFESSVRLHKGDGFRRFSGQAIKMGDAKLVVTVRGDILEVEKMLCLNYHVYFFCIYKVYSPRLFRKRERVDSLGDEAMLLDLGITVLANGIEGLKKNSIYFSGGKNCSTDEICLFDLEAKKTEPLHKFDSSAQLATARWFLPSFESKCFFSLI